ncbi:hypothetical protein QMZ92_08815 [Streptomyces sp. HNM0645]|uniref:hypothetical protein n=1 Tax=Streptomyces sp. HNM0645 TaxID=2782343 RepID=UPI0024B83EC4|nr:hypothetical protein [Streptomyces sp. HNM0645]MDI9884500.1 hypothetical protein [Streptomyces sp. HNM0645]
MRAESSPAARTGAFIAVALSRVRLVLAASVVPMAVRHRLAVHGRVPPLASGAPCGRGLP